MLWKGVRHRNALRCLAKLQAVTFGEIVGGDECLKVFGKAGQRFVVEGLDRGFLKGTVHPFRLTVRPRVVWLRELVSDAVLATDAVKYVAR